MVSNSEWSDELKGTTRTVLEKPPLELSASLFMKNCDGSFGTMLMVHLMVYEWTVTDRAGTVRTYDSIAALLAAGWVID